MTQIDTDAPDLPSGIELGTIARRAAGLLIDSVLVVVPVLVGAVLLGLDLRDDVSADEVLALNAAIIGLGTIHEIVGVAIWGKTIGKHLVGLQVVRSDDGGPVGWAYAAIRSLVTSAATLVPTVGIAMTGAVYLWAMVDPRRQGLHDKAAGTLVRRIRETDFA